MNSQKRLQSAFRRFEFEVIKAIGVFWLIDRIPWFDIRDPWNTLYKRSLK